MFCIGSYILIGRRTEIRRSIFNIDGGFFKGVGVIGKRRMMVPIDILTG